MNILLIEFVNRLSVGYFLWDVMLLKISATIKRINTPVNTGNKTYRYPNALIFSDPITAINAVAPPGGCRVF